jgi:hypothetical protein
MLLEKMIILRRRFFHLQLFTNEKLGFAGDSIGDLDGIEFL